MNGKGFILAETITVSAVVLGVLIIIYTQFVNVSKNYGSSFTYNNVDKLYSVDNIKQYITSDGIENLKTALQTSNYVDITNCSSDYFIELSYCDMLFNNLNVKTVLFTKENTTALKSDNLSKLSPKLVSFINYIVSDNEERYRLIVEFNDGNFATLKVD